MEGREARFRCGALGTPADREHEKRGGEDPAGRTNATGHARFATRSTGQHDRPPSRGATASKGDAPRPHVPNHAGSFPGLHLMLQPTLAC